MTFKEKLQARAIKNASAKVIKKLSPYEIIISPMVTEKTHKQQADYNKYSFRVHKDANKNDVKEALIYMYRVTPEKINIINVVFKGRSQKKLVRRAYKKAVVTLSKKEKIEIWA